MSESKPSVEQLYQQTQEFMANEEYEEALESARLLLARDDSSYQHWLLEGSIRVALGEWQPAERAYRRACQEAPDQPVPLLQWANIALVMGQPGEALARAEQALAVATQANEQRDAYVVQAEALLSSAQARLAALLDEEDQRQVGKEPPQGEVAETTEFSPSVGEAWTAPSGSPLADEEVLGDLQRGLEIVNKALALDRNIPELWDLQGSYLTTMGNAKEAAKAWQQATRLAPQNAQYWHELGTTMATLRNYGEAQRAFRRAYDIDILQGADDLAFLLEDFVTWVEQAWTEIEEEWISALDIDLPVVVMVESYPPREKLDKAKRDEIFDPRTPLYIDSVREGGATAIRITLYHHNVEREAATASPDELYLTLYHLLEEAIHSLMDAIWEDEIHDVI